MKFYDSMGFESEHRIYARRADVQARIGRYGDRIEQMQTRIAELEAFLNLCYEEKMVPTSDDLDALKVPVSFSDSAVETFDEQQSGPTDVEPSIKMKNEMREILGHEPLADQPIPDNTWLCVCGYVVKKRYICLCGGRENNSEASRFEAKISDE